MSNIETDPENIDRSVIEALLPKNSSNKSRIIVDDYLVRRENPTSAPVTGQDDRGNNYDLFREIVNIFGYLSS